jgi:hypothetical protein
MAGCMHSFDLKPPEGQTFAVTKQAVELTAVDRHFGCVENFLEDSLHGRDGAADGDFAAGLPPEMLGGTQMIGMRVRLQDPDNPHAGVAGRREQLVGGRRRGAAGLVVEIEHRIDHRRFARNRVGNEVGHGESRLVKEGLNAGGHGGYPRERP